MSHRGERIYEFELEAGSHVYRMEVCLARTGSRYLRLTDFRIKDDGERPCLGVVVFDDHAPEFLWALAKAVAHLDDDACRASVEEGEGYLDSESDIAAIRREYHHAYEPWSAADDARLRLAYSQGDRIETIARALKRQPSAVTGRLRKLGVL